MFSNLYISDILKPLVVISWIAGNAYKINRLDEMINCKFKSFIDVPIKSPVSFKINLYIVSE